MERILLYYPFTRLVDGLWLKSALLYSDKVSSIVPYWRGMYDDNMLYQPHLNLLKDEGQYTPILTSDLFYGKAAQDYSNIGNDFFDFIKMVNLKERLNHIGTEENDLLPTGFFTPSRVIDYFEQTGNIDSNRSHDNSMRINRVVGAIYHSFLASYVADKSDLYIVPSTDLGKYESLLFKTNTLNKEAFNLILERCLPVPREDCSLEKIIRFKRKRRDELLRFRNIIDDIKNNIESAESRAEVKEILVKCSEKIELGINDLVKSGMDGSLNFIFSSFTNLLKLENPKLFLSLTGAGLLSTINAAVGLSVGSVGVTASLIATFREQKSRLNKSELSYLFHAKKQKIL